MRLEELIARLGLQPHPQEGGWYVETYRSGERLLPGAIPGRTAERPLSTAIYFLVSPGHFSELHRLPSDEVFHFYLGDPVEMLLLPVDGPARMAVLGTDLGAGMRPQLVVPAGTWQGARLRPGGNYALLGTTVAPGFEPGDYERGDAEALTQRWPEAAARIRALVRRA